MSLSVLRHRGFNHYLASRAASGLAIQVQSVSVGWQIYDATRDPFALGLVGLAQFLPFLLLVLVSGSIADRYSRRMIMVLCAASQVACAGALVLLASGGGAPIWPIFLILVGFGATRALAIPAQQALVPSLVPASEFGSAVALTSAVGRLTVIAGPVAGGLLYTLSAPAAYGTALCLFLAASLAASLIPRPVPTTRRGAAGWRDAVAGFAHLWGDKPLLGVMSLDLFAVLLGGATALLPVYARDILHVGPAGLGLLLAAPATGALTVALALAARPIRRDPGRVMFGSILCFGLAIAVFGLSTTFWLSFLALVVAGIGDMTSVCVRQTLLQIWTPDALRGRVSAVNSVFTGASNELGAFRAGTFAVLVGTAPTVVFGGLGTVAVTLLWMRLFPELRRIRGLERR